MSTDPSCDVKNLQNIGTQIKSKLLEIQTLLLQDF